MDMLSALLARCEGFLSVYSNGKRDVFFVVSMNKLYYER